MRYDGNLKITLNCAGCGAQKVLKLFANHDGQQRCSGCSRLLPSVLASFEMGDKEKLTIYLGKEETQNLVFSGRREHLPESFVI